MHDFGMHVSSVSLSSTNAPVHSSLLYRIYAGVSATVPSLHACTLISLFAAAGWILSEVLKNPNAF